MDQALLKEYGLTSEYYTREELAAIMEVLGKALNYFTKKGDVIEVAIDDKVYAILDNGEEFKIYSTTKEPSENLQ